MYFDPYEAFLHNTVEARCNMLTSFLVWVPIDARFSHSIIHRCFYWI